MTRQDSTPHAGAEIIAMSAPEDRPVRQDSLRDGVLIWRGIDALESSVTTPQEPVEVDGGLTRHSIRPDDLAVDPDAQSNGEERTGEIDRNKSVVAEHEAVSACRVVIGADDLPPIIDSRRSRSIRGGKFHGSEIKAALDCRKSRYG
jgi:hypothetical protein